MASIKRRKEGVPSGIAEQAKFNLPMIDCKQRKVTERSEVMDCSSKHTVYFV